MLDKIPSHEEIEELIGTSAMATWNDLNEFVKANYDFEAVWDHGGKNAVF